MTFFPWDYASWKPQHFRNSPFLWKIIIIKSRNKLLRKYHRLLGTTLTISKNYWNRCWILILIIDLISSDYKKLSSSDRLEDKAYIYWINLHLNSLNRRHRYTDHNRQGYFSKLTLINLLFAIKIKIKLKFIFQEDIKVP